MARAFIVLAMALLCAPWPVAAAGQGDDGLRPTGPPVSGQRVRDPQFGVSSARFGLRRTVRMYQWQRQPSGYAKVWSETWIDPARHAAGHANPPPPSLASRQWLDEGATLDGHPIDAATLEKVGHWQPFRPGFTALSERQAAVFQPEGDGLGSALNPMHPAIGDLRIGWEQLHLPALHDRLVLRGGRWTVLPQQRGEAASLSSPPASTATAAGWLDWLRTRWWALLAGAAGLVIVLRWLRR